MMPFRLAEEPGAQQASLAKPIAKLCERRSSVSSQSVKQVLLSLDAAVADRQESHLPSFLTPEHDRQYCSVEPKLSLSFL
jgi:hypothetical protein